MRQVQGQGQEGRYRVKKVAGILTVALLAWSGAAFAGHEDCTHGGAGSNITGTNGNDTCNGTSAGENMFGREGADRFTGFGGFDDLNMGNGHDYANGSEGADAVHGDTGNDRINGNDGDDNVRDIGGASDHDHGCDGPGVDSIRLDDGDGQDTWYNYPDGDGEFEVVLDAGDDISDNNSNCPQP